ncbi:MarR family winged helix-turn-helix transcriptional regulator [Alkalicoccobacillus porphyridii]|uniref:Winged helix-turn-helix transcriptional regulator n=1 Tax=Alkalicoccobacillus porphyridii TaxID=2597270 RepID=A0A553ZYW4_9BACI|nr:MarR family winged helix-turn-helix transcriptional regulator [Alkalicoccobacillus porphyridii]TSB46640.1 winged helix-turn-helix transcriptional regulator [Alkalicoccobacillus porphyridii]
MSTELFKQFMSFTMSVHQVTYELTKHARFGPLTPLQYEILEYVFVSQPVSPTEISECKYISLPNTSRELKKLHSSNLIEKVLNKQDGRKHSVVLSDEGEKLIKNIFEETERLFYKRVGQVSHQDSEEIQAAFEMLKKKIYY